MTSKLRQDQSSCDTLKGVDRKTSSGRKHAFSTLLWMVMLLLLATNVHASSRIRGKIRNARHRQCGRRNHDALRKAKQKKESKAYKKQMEAADKVYRNLMHGSTSTVNGPINGQRLARQTRRCPTPKHDPLAVKYNDLIDKLDIQAKEYRERKKQLMECLDSGANDENIRRIEDDIRPAIIRIFKEDTRVYGELVSVRDKMVSSNIPAANSLEVLKALAKSSEEENTSQIELINKVIKSWKSLREFEDQIAEQEREFAALSKEAPAADNAVVEAKQERVESGSPMAEADQVRSTFEKELADMAQQAADRHARRAGRCWCWSKPEDNDPQLPKKNVVRFVPLSNVKKMVDKHKDEIDAGSIKMHYVLEEIPVQPSTQVKKNA